MPDALKLRLIYLHGFRSSPASAKGRELAAAAREWGADFFAPDLNLPPLEADRVICGLLEPLSAAERRRTLVTGSSLGGFYALRAARLFGCPAAAVNPCLTPWDFVPDQVGLQTIFGTDRTLLVEPSFADDFRALAKTAPPAPEDPADALLLLSTADEVLDWRAADRAFPESPKIILSGDDHRMQRFAECLPAMRGFFERRMR